MSKKFPLSAAGALAASLVAGAAEASQVNFIWSATIENSIYPGIAVGDNVVITVALDNGNTSLVSQIWTADDLQFVADAIGATQSTFTAPFGGDGLTWASGNFVTNASGLLTSVLSDGGDLTVGTDVTSNLTVTPTVWELWGVNIAFVAQATGDNADFVQTGFRAFSIPLYGRSVP